MVNITNPANSVLERLTTAIDKKFGKVSRFGLSHIAYALFYHYLFQLSADKTDLTKRNLCLNSILDELEQEKNAWQFFYRQPFLFNCLADIMKALREEDDVAAALIKRFYEWNNRLIASPDPEPRLNKIGYLTGWAGMMNYFLALPERSEHRKYLVERYGEYLKSRLPLMYDHDLFFLPDEQEQTDMGLAKGVCGVLTVMTDLALEIKSKVITDFIANAINRLITLRQEVDQSENKCSFFPYKIDHTRKVAFYDNRLSWSNSDLGQALLLCKASTLCNNYNYLKMAEMISLNTLLRKHEAHTGIYDASIAHGAAGVATVYRKLFKNIGNEDLFKGYIFWITLTIELAEKEMNELPSEGKTADILEGPAGIGLALMTYKSEKISDWSKTILV